MRWKEGRDKGLTVSLTLGIIRGGVGLSLGGLLDWVNGLGW